MRVARAALLLAALFGAHAGPGSTRAWAEPHSGVDSQLYRPAVDSGGVFSVNGGATLPRYDLAVQLALGYGQRPFRVAVPGIGDSVDDPVLESVLALHMTLGLGLTDRLTLVLDTGLYRTTTGAGYGSRGLYSSMGSEPSTGLISLRPTSNFDPSGGSEAHGLSGPLDTRVGLKLGLLSRPSLRIAILGLVSLPFGDEEMFLGDQGLVLMPRLAVDYGLARGTRLMIDIGPNLRERTVLEAYDPDTSTEEQASAVFDLGSEMFIGAGITQAVGPRIIAAAEAVLLVPLPSAMSYGRCQLNSGSRCSTLDENDYFGNAGYGDLAGYAIAGLRFRHNNDIAFTGSLGAGIAGARRENIRLLAGIVWTPVPRGALPLGAGDRDRDGVPDATDICPDEGEDDDGFQDDDGCPDPDNDGDGMADARDACPGEAEDRDGNRDNDGCPEGDNDSDRIDDVNDRCPAHAEDVDGFEDDDGCPDPDNDGDDIADADDACPNEAETKNGIDDSDGCPDAQNSTGSIEAANRIDLRGSQITFAGARSARIDSASQPLLRQVADSIKRSRVGVRVEVHVPLSTRSKSSQAIARARKADKALAQQRAKAIIDYLVSREDVPANLLEAAGKGSEQPLEQPATSAANARVDFLFIDVDGRLGDRRQRAGATGKEQP